MDIKNNTVLKRIDWLSWLGLTVLILLPIFCYSSLPETIPIHFNASGKADGFGQKNWICLLPILGVVMYWGLNKLTFVPHKFNYMVDVNEENKQRQYRNAVMMMKVMNLMIVWTFAYITFMMIVSANSENISGLGSAFIYIFLFSFLASIFYYTYKSYKLS